MTWLMEILKDLPRRTPSDKELRDKAFIVAKNIKYDAYQDGLASINFLIKRLLVLIFLVVLVKVKLCQTNN